MQNQLSAIQKRFDNATEKEHWEKLKTLLFSGQRERRNRNELVGDTR